MPEKLNQHRFRGMWGRRALLVATALLAGVLVPLGEAPADAAPADLAAQAAPAVPATPTAAAAAASVGGPVVATGTNGGALVLVRGADGIVHRRAHNPEKNTWSAWESTGGKAAGDPVTARNLNKRTVVFVRRDSGRLWYQRQQADGAWSEWSDLGTPPGTTAAGVPAVVANDNTYSSPAPNDDGVVRGNTDGRLELFVRGADNQIWHRVQKAPNGTSWSGWEALPGEWAGNPTAAVSGNGRISVFARKSDGRLRVTAQKAPGTPDDPLPENNWAPWQQIGTGHTGNVSVALNNRKKGTFLQVFGNRGGDGLWTVTQSEPGTAKNPTGTWATDSAQRIGPATPGRPVVIAHSDGRLVVHGINADGYVAYRTQTSASTQTAPNGIWAAGWKPLGDQKADSVAVRSAPHGTTTAFDVFAIGKGTATLHQRSRLSAGTGDGSREDVWLDWADLSPVGDGPCSGPGSLECLNIESAGLGQVLSLENSLKPDSNVTRDPQRNQPGQKWALKKTDDPRGAVTIVNRTKDRCLDEDDDLVSPYHLVIAPCDPEREEQMWYIEPVLPKGSDAGKDTASTFRLRHRADPDSCLTALAEDAWPHTARMVELIDCDTDAENDHNTWRFGNKTLIPGETAATAPGVLDIVLQQAALRCADDPEANTCEFVALDTPKAYQAAGGCVAGQVLYNQSPDRDAQYYISWAHTSGTQFSFGRTVGVSIEFLSSEFSLNFSWLQEDTKTEQVQVPVPPKQFGWVELSPVLRETIGYWRITLDGHKWTVPGHNVSYAKSGTDGVKTYLVPRTSDTPPQSEHCD
ncbi:RICIN domain-containing protein [Streptomyces filamentosus]|uniref:RICIN domain-containing protein n=3 Tax=Streptomyces TaxID=1883 RepID=A0ABY4V2N4_STRFL|nr:MULTISPECIES: RICIN domain-containing protein [Streptomyces]USC49938.1 RICIN domain-containing protein [Streptomyces filamentosus]